MAEGIAEKLRARWHSDRVRREVTFVRWGHWGQPVLLFPTAGGDAEEVERMWLVESLRPLIDGGRIKVYSCDSVNGRAMISEEGSPQHRMWIQDQYHQFVRHEVVPAIRRDCGDAEQPIWTAGASIGAFNAVAVLCRFPDVFSRAIGMSGTYDLSRFLDVPSEALTDHFRVSSPVHFLPHLGGRHLDVLRERFVMLMSGRGRAENIGESFRMAEALGRRGVPNWVDDWGPEWPHDWPSWRRMLPATLTKWTSAAEVP